MTLDELNELHQLPENHPVSRRARISLAHIDVAGLLRRDSAEVMKRTAKARAASEVAASALGIGQAVAMKNNRNSVGRVVAIDGATVSVEINGKVRKFTGSSLVAA